MASVYNNVYGLTGYYSNGGFASTFFMAVLSNGLLLSSKVYNTSVFGNDTRAINKTIDGGFIMVGEIGVTSPSSSNIYLIRTNTYGDTLWTKQYDNAPSEVGQTVVQTSDSGFAIAAYINNGQSDIMLLKTDSIGNTLWTKTYNFYSSQFPNTIQQTSDGGYFIVGSVVDISLGARKVYLIRTNPTGDTLWTRNYGGIPWTSHGYFVRQTMDRGFIISGSTGNFGAGTYIIKTDSMGLVNTITGIAEINNSLQFDLFPNPSAGFFTVTTNGLPGKSSILNVYNITNQLIYSCPLNNGVAEEIDLSSYPSGIYMAVLYLDQNVVLRKIVIQN